MPFLCIQITFYAFWIAFLSTDCASAYLGEAFECHMMLSMDKFYLRFSIHLLMHRNSIQEGNSQS